MTAAERAEIRAMVARILQIIDKDEARQVDDKPKRRVPSEPSPDVVAKVLELRRRRALRKRS